MNQQHTNDEKVNQLKIFLHMWAIAQLSNSPSTKLEEITLALRMAADELDKEKELLPDALKKLLR